MLTLAELAARLDDAIAAARGKSKLERVTARQSSALDGFRAPKGENDDYQGDNRRTCGLAGARDTETRRAGCGEVGFDAVCRTQYRARFLHPFRSADYRDRGAAASACGLAEHCSLQRHPLTALERDIGHALAARATVRRADHGWRCDAARRGWRTREGRA